MCILCNQLLCYSFHNQNKKNVVQRFTKPLKSMSLLISAGCLANCQGEMKAKEQVCCVEKAALKSKMKKKDDAAQNQQFSQY